MGTPLETMRPGGGVEGAAACAAGAGARRTFLDFAAAGAGLWGSALGTVLAAVRFGCRAGLVLAAFLDGFATWGAFTGDAFFFLAPGGACVAGDCFFAGFLADFAFGVAAFATGAAERAAFFGFEDAFSGLALEAFAAVFEGFAGFAAFALGLDFVARLAFAPLSAACAAALGAVECLVARTFGLPPFRRGLAADADAAFFAFVARAAIS